jgi:hypothetical protein
MQVRIVHAAKLVGDGIQGLCPQPNDILLLFVVVRQGHWHQSDFDSPGAELRALSEVRRQTASTLPKKEWFLEREPCTNRHALQMTSPKSWARDKEGTKRGKRVILGAVAVWDALWLFNTRGRGQGGLMLNG